jgi:hypothetical protein
VGDLAVAWLLLEQAAIAHARLQAAGADQEFYQAKLMTARYFAHERLPLCQARIKIIRAGDRLPMEMAETCF